MSRESTGASGLDEKPLGARELLSGERLRERKRAPARHARLLWQPADEPDLGLEALVGARVEVVQAARQPAKPRSLVVAEIAHDRPAVLEKRAFVVGAIPERTLEREEPLALFPGSALPVQETTRERVRRVRGARREAAGGNRDGPARADGLREERVETRERLERVQKIEVVKHGRLGLFLLGQGSRLERDRCRPHGDDVRGGSLAGVGARACRPGGDRSGGNGFDRGRRCASPSKEARGRERRDCEHGHGARKDPGAPPRGAGPRRQPLPQARLEVGRRLGGRPGANEPIESGVVAGRGTARRAFLEMGDDGRVPALRGRRRIHDPLAELVAGHDVAAGALPGPDAPRSAASGSAGAGGEPGASRSGRRKTRRFSSARTRRRRSSVSEMPSASAAAPTESLATRVRRNALRSPPGNAAIAERTRAVRADGDSASFGAGISRTLPGLGSWTTLATRLQRNSEKVDAGE